MKTANIIKKMPHLKWNYAGHVGRTTDSRWNRKIYFSGEIRTHSSCRKQRTGGIRGKPILNSGCTRHIRLHYFKQTGWMHIKLHLLFSLTRSATHYSCLDVAMNTPKMDLKQQ